MEHSREYQQQLIDEWFDGKYYIKITSVDDKKAFYNYIANYDLRYLYDSGIESDNTPMYYAWRFCNGLHHHQLSYTSEENYWNGKQLDYEDIRMIVKYNNDIGLADITKRLLQNGGAEE